jgi:hypothetical protein
MTLPDRDVLTRQLHDFVRTESIVPTATTLHWRSGVYAVLDCVYSSMAKFEEVVLPTLKRFGERSGLQDVPELKFSAFIKDVDERFPGPEGFDTYAKTVMGNRQRLSGRSKVEVAYEVCRFFASRKHETVGSLRSLPPGEPETLGELECLVLHRMMASGPAHIRGIGVALGPYLLMSLGVETYVKPDTLLLRLLGRIGGWQPRAGHPGDLTLIRAVVTAVAQELNSTPARLDNALWQYERERARRHRSDHAPVR